MRAQLYAGGCAIDLPANASWSAAACRGNATSAALQIVDPSALACSASCQIIGASTSNRLASRSIIGAHFINWSRTVRIVLMSSAVNPVIFAWYKIAGPLATLSLTKSGQSARGRHEQGQSGTFTAAFRPDWRGSERRGRHGSTVRFRPQLAHLVAPVRPRRGRGALGRRAGRSQVAGNDSAFGGCAGGLMGHHPRDFPVSGEHRGGSRRPVAGELARQADPAGVGGYAAIEAGGLGRVPHWNAKGLA